MNCNEINTSELDLNMPINFNLIDQKVRPTHNYIYLGDQLCRQIDKKREVGDVEGAIACARYANQMFAYEATLTAISSLYHSSPSISGSRKVVRELKKKLINFLERAI